MNCPKCGNSNIISTPITTTIQSSKTKGFGFISACLGYLLFSWIGILCGLCGMGKGKTKTKTSTKVINKCQNCGKEF